MSVRPIDTTFGNVLLTRFARRFAWERVACQFRAIRQFRHNIPPYIFSVSYTSNTIPSQCQSYGGTERFHALIRRLPVEEKKSMMVEITSHRDR